MSKRYFKFIQILLLGFCFCFCEISFAMLFTFSPSTMYLQGANDVRVLEIENTSSNKFLTFQINPVLWTRNWLGDNVYQATNELLVTPPVFHLKPGEKQLIRVGTRLTDSDLAVGKAYHLQIKNIEGENAKSEIKSTKERKLNLKFNVVIGLPVLVEPKNIIEKLDWYLDFSSDKVTVKVKNTGNSVVILGKVQAFAADKKALPIVSKNNSASIFPSDDAKFIFKATPVEIATKKISLGYTLVKREGSIEKKEFLEVK